MSMTSKPDLGVWIAGASAAAVLAAIVAGLMSVANPFDARAQRLDAATLARMGDIAEAAQCAYSFTGAVPADLGAIEAAFRERKVVIEACDGVGFGFVDETAISYAAAGDAHIELCAEFRRASPPAPRDEFAQRYRRADFVELAEARPAPGRHCFRLRLVRWPRESAG
jgi:hypothetical protein